MGQPVDFFVSYTGVDQGWANWIAWQLTAAGYEVMVQTRDFRPGNDFVHLMQQGTSGAERTIAVLSPAYFSSGFGEAEWRVAFAHDPTGELGLLIPVRVVDMDPPGLLATRIYIDLVDKDEDRARALLLDGVSVRPPRPGRRPASSTDPGNSAAPPFPGSSRAMQPAWSGTEDHRLPPKPRCFGRAAMVSDLVETLLAEQPPPVPVLGPPGIGKSNLCLTALHDARIVAHFGERRFFVRCDGSTTADALLVRIGATLGIVADAGLDSRVRKALTRRPCVLVLDNIETPWEGHPLAVEHLLGWLASMNGVRLVVSLRGVVRPNGPAWREAINLLRLPPDAARELFLAGAGQRFADDGDLLGLIEELDGMPLAIELLAKVAEAESTLAAVRKRWDSEEHAAMLTRGTSEKRELSLPVSLKLSINARRMNDQAHRLLSLLCLFPDGLLDDDVTQLQPSTGRRSATRLQEVGLAFAERDRLRVLKPIRDYIREAHPPGVEDHPAVARWFRSLVDAPLSARRSSKIAAIERLVAESANLHAVAAVAGVIGPVDEFKFLYELATLRSRWRSQPAEVLRVLARFGFARKAIADTEMVGDLRKRCQAYIPIAQGLSATTERDEATSSSLRLLVEGLREDALQIGSPWRSADALAAIAQVVATLGDARQGRAIGVRAHEIAASLESPRDRVSSLVAVADAMAAAGDLETSRVALREAHALAGDLTGSREQAHLLDLIAKSLLARGEHAAALELAAEARTVVGQLADRRHQDHARVVVVRILAGVGDVSGARQMLTSITEPEMRSIALAVVAQALAVAGSIKEALGLLKEVTIAGSRAAVLATIAERLLESGYREEAVDALAEARLIANEPPQLHNVAHAVVAMAGALLEAGHGSAAATALRHAQGLTEAMTAVKEQVHALAALARQFGAMERRQEADAALAQAVALIEPIDDIREQAHAWAAIGWVLTGLGEPEQAIVLARRARELAERVPNLIERVYCLVAVAELFAAAGSVEDALALAEQAWEVLGRSHDRAPVPTMQATVVRALVALKRLRAARDLAEGIGDRVEKGLALAEVAIGLAVAGRARAGEACELADRALAISERSAHEDKRDTVRLRCVWVYLIAGRLDEAGNLAGELRFPFSRADALAVIANAHARTGRLEEARKWLGQSLRLAAERDQLRTILNQAAPALVAVHGPETTLAIMEALLQVDERHL